MRQAPVRLEPCDDQGAQACCVACRTGRGRGEAADGTWVIMQPGYSIGGVMPDDKMFMHSKCCNAHWELVWNGGMDYDLQCEECGTSIGPAIKVAGPYYSERKCDSSGCQNLAREEDE